MPVASINGIEIYYRIQGEGYPCLIMHGGLGLDHTYLYSWLDPLADTWEMVFYDHRGNGRSGQAPPETMTHDQFVADASALISHIGLNKVAVMGHSYGGYIALEFALRFPRRVSHLILVDTAAHTDYGEEKIANAIQHGATEEMLDALGREVSTPDEMSERMKTISPLYFFRYEPEIAGRLMREVKLRPSGSAVEGEYRSYNVIPRLPEIEIPTLILVGEHDFVCPPSQAKILHDGIPGSELVVFRKSGHFPYIEEPDKFFSSIVEWFGANS